MTQKKFSRNLSFQYRNVSVGLSVFKGKMCINLIALGLFTTMQFTNLCRDWNVLMFCINHWNCYCKSCKSGNIKENRPRLKCKIDKDRLCMSLILVKLILKSIINLQILIERLLEFCHFLINEKYTSYDWW